MFSEYEGHTLSPVVVMHVFFSLFADKIELNFIDGSQEKPVGLIRKGIAWDSDKKYKFNNPDLNGKTWQQCESKAVQN